MQVPAYPWIRGTFGDRTALSVAAALVIAVAALDLAVPLGVAVGMAYVLPVVLTLAHRAARATWVVAVLCSALVIVGWLASEPGGVPWMAETNRFLSLFVIWVTAFGIQMQRSTASALARELGHKMRILDRSPAMVLLLDETGRLAYANPSAVQVLGASGTVDGAEWVAEVVIEDQRDEQRDHLARVLRTSSREHRQCAVDLVAADGDVRHVTMVDSVYELEDGRPGVLRCGVDVTDTARIEEERARQSSMARLGEMAALIAHEIKNPLAGIAGTLQVFANRLPDDASELGVLDAMQERISHLDRSIDDLLTFARPQGLTHEHLDLRDVVGLATEMIAAIPANENVVIEVAGEEACPAWGDEQLLSAAFMNLLSNAADAVGAEGRVVAELIAGPEEHVVRIIDDGPGIEPETLARIFDPFFTTKLQGTGLGLVIARRTFEAHDGVLKISSVLGEGTIAEVSLSSTAADAVRRSPAVERYRQSS